MLISQCRFHAVSPPLQNSSTTLNPPPITCSSLLHSHSFKPAATTDHSAVSILFPFPECDLVGITQQVVFSDWLLYSHLNFNCWNVFWPLFCRIHWVVSISLLLSNLIMIHLAIIFFIFLVLGVHWAFWICGFMFFIKYRSFLVSFSSKYFFCPPPFSGKSIYSYIRPQIMR